MNLKFFNNVAYVRNSYFILRKKRNFLVRNDFMIYKTRIQKTQKHVRSYLYTLNSVSKKHDANLGENWRV